MVGFGWALTVSTLALAFLFQWQLGADILAFTWRWWVLALLVGTDIFLIIKGAMLG